MHLYLTHEHFERHYKLQLYNLFYKGIGHEYVYSNGHLEVRGKIPVGIWSSGVKRGMDMCIWYGQWTKVYPPFQVCFTRPFGFILQCRRSFFRFSEDDRLDVIGNFLQKLSFKTWILCKILVTNNNTSVIFWQASASRWKEKCKW